MIRPAFPSLAVLALIATTTATFADGLTARVSSDKMALGDTFQLTLGADPAKLTAAPDVSPLNADFDILGTSKSSQTRIINGTRSDMVEWIITLAPRAKGHLIIPALTAGQATSEVLSVDVVDVADLPADRQAPGETAITLSLEPGSHYVQQEIPLTLRITSGAGFRGGTIQAPQSPDYILEQRGEDRASQMTSNGQPVTVIERDYLLRPQQAGALTIAPFTLRATQNDPAARSPFPSGSFDSFFGGSPFGGAGSPFGQMFNPGREVVVRTAPLTVEVKANPSGSAGWFLPAKEVTLAAEWDPRAPVFRVGEAVTRHIRIQALGATEVQLPDLAMPEITGARVYLETSQTGSLDTPQGTAAVRDFTYSIVPTTGGTVTLPEVTLEWFDTSAETARVATLPADTITVEGAVTAAPAAPKTPAESVAAPIAAGDQGDAMAMGWIIALVIAIVAALTVALSLRMRRSGVQGTHSHKADPVGSTRANLRKAALRQLEVACDASDPNAAYAAALRWLNAVAPGIAPENGSVRQAFPNLGDTWHDLESRAFSARVTGDWDAQRFLRDLRAADKDAHKAAKRPPQAILPPLYASA